MGARRLLAAGVGVSRGLVATAAASALVVGAGGPATAIRAGARASSGDQGIHKIRHVVVIMQENRSFDSYFGTFRGADGIPM
jgi:phospholipase C